MKRLWCCFNHLAFRGILNRLIGLFEKKRIQKKSCQTCFAKGKKLSHNIFSVVFFIFEKIIKKLISICAMAGKNHYNLFQMTKIWYESRYWLKVSQIKVNLLVCNKKCIDLSFSSPSLSGKHLIL